MFVEAEVSRFQHEEAPEGALSKRQHLNPDEFPRRT